MNKFTDFLIEFNDINNDGAFSMSEFVSFSGPTITGFVFFKLISSPHIPNISLNSDPNFYDDWRVSGVVGTASLPTRDFTYAISGITVASTVPLPTALPLLAAGTAAFGIAARLRKRRGASALAA